MYPAAYQLNIITIPAFVLLTEGLIAYLYFGRRLVTLLHVNDASFLFCCISLLTNIAPVDAESVEWTAALLKLAQF